MSISKQVWKGVAAALLASTVLCVPARAYESVFDEAIFEDLPSFEIPSDDVLEDADLQTEADMPALILPLEDMENKKPDGESLTDEMSDPSHYMMNLIRGQLTDRYVSAEEIDADRINALLSGDFIKDYIHDGDPVSFSNTIFDIDAANRKRADAAQAATPEPAPAAAPAGVDFLLSPAAIRAMSAMSADQIEAIALMVEMMNNPGAAPSINSQLELKGIPSLSENDLVQKSPEELLAHISRAGNAPAYHSPEPPMPVSVGDGKIMALHNWEMIISPDGRVEMSNATIPGSRFEVVPGVVVGQFGRVLDISLEEGNQFIAFESGDRLEVPHVPLNYGVPALDGIEDPDGEMLNGEILVSGPVMRGDEVLVAEADPGRQLAETDQDRAEGAARVIRPKARPDRIGKEHGGDGQADANDPDTQSSKSSALTATHRGN